jgi:hypothetical protein
VWECVPLLISARSHGEVNQTIFNVEWEPVAIFLNVRGKSGCLGGFVMDKATIMFQLDAGQDEIAFRTVRGLVDLNDARSLVAGGESSTMDKLTVLDGVVVEGCDIGGACMLTFHAGGVSEHTSIGPVVKLGSSTACAGKVADSVSGNIGVSTW